MLLALYSSWQWWQFLLGYYLLFGLYRTHHNLPVSWSFRQNLDQYLLCWWANQSSCTCCTVPVLAFLEQCVGWWNVYSHPYQEWYGNQATTNWNSDFLCSWRWQSYFSAVVSVVWHQTEHTISCTCLTLCSWCYATGHPLCNHLIFQQFTTTLESVMAYKHLQLGHYLIAIHCLKHLQHFWHWSS